jgi:endonuclease/exonuclease/phosphatase family metal-dependent hydrolase
VVAAEVSNTTAPPLTRAFATVLPHHVDTAPNGPTGVGVWSRFPVKKVVDPRAVGLPIVEVDVRLPEGPLRVYAVHVASPRSGERHEWAADLRRVATIVADRPARSIVAGDFNATRWNAEFRPILHTGLTDARVGGSWWEPSWPHALYKLPSLMPIDHILLAHGIESVGSKTYTLHGSDRRGSIAELGGPLLSGPTG